MAHHAYLVVGDLEEGIARAEVFAEKGAEVVTLRYGQFTVDDARALADTVQRASSERVIVVAVRRFFHEAQNALLKVFEEPPSGTTLVLVLEGAGALLPTLRSRLVPLPGTRGSRALPASAEAFIAGTAAAREKLVAKLLERAKSDKPEEKQAARADALVLVEGIAHAAHAKSEAPGMRDLLSDLSRFAPILHERAAPLKPILEHLLIVAPSARAFDK